MTKTRALSYAVTSVVTAMVSQAYAVDDFWTGAVDSVFTNAANYTATPIIGTNRQVFNLASAGAAGLSVTVPATPVPANPGSSGAAPNNIAFDTDAGSYTFSGGRFLFQANGGVLANLLSSLNGTPTITFNNDIQDFNGRNTAASLTFTNSKSGASLVVNSNIAGGATTGQQVYISPKMASQTGATLATSIAFNGILSDGTSGGQIVLQRTGGGGNLTQTFVTGANTYSGGTELGNGSGLLGLGNKAALGTGALRLLDVNNIIQATTPLAGANAVANTINYVSNTFAATPTTTTANLSFTLGSPTATLNSGVAPAVGDFVRAGNSTVLPIYARVTAVVGNQVTFDVNAIATSALAGNVITTTAYAGAGGGTVNINGANDLELSGTQNLTTLFSNGAAATQIFNVTNTGVTTFSGVLQQQGGVASITKQGTGTLVLTGANTYTGTTTISNGSLIVGNGGTLGTGPVIENAGLSFSNTTIPQTIPNAISGANGISRTGNGFTTLTGVNTYAGPTNIFGGTIALGTGGTLGAGQVNVGGALAFTGTDAKSVPNVITGAGTVTQTGSGTTTLSGANTYTGVTTVNNSAATLKVTTAASNPLLVNAGGTNIANGQLQFDYTGGSSPAAAIRALLVTGYGAGFVNGGGFVTGQIRSSTATANRGLGYKDNGAGLVTIRSTLYGDADLNGAVNIDDFNALSISFATGPGKVWVDGDFNYDGVVNIDDFNALSINFGTSTPSAAEWVDLLTFATTNGDRQAFLDLPGVPEPTGLAAAGLVAAAGLRRRRMGRTRHD